MYVDLCWPVRFGCTFVSGAQ